MGKVGSTTLHRTIARSDFDVPVFHVHFLPTRKTIRNWRTETNNLTKKVLPDHLCTSITLKIGMTLFPRNEVWIIPSVRELIGRQVFLFFQIPYVFDPRFDRPVDQLDAKEVSDFLNDYLVDLGNFSFPRHWFDKEMNAYFSIDVQQFQL